jgi:hypothetical protein
LAHNYVDYADTEVFVRDIRQSEKKDDAKDAEGSDSSQDEEKLRTPTLKLQSRDLPQSEVMAPFLLLDPALPKPMSPLPQFHLPAALLPPLPLKLCSTNTLSFIRSPVYRVQM